MEQFYPIMVALSFNVLDMATGFIKAIKTKDIQSSKLRDGLFKKVGFILCYVLALMVDTQGDLIGFSISTPVLPIIVAYACLTEMTSIIENIAVINPDILPDKLKSMFHIEDESVKE